ncbi:nuclear transport factor 2 family protein [Nonomuraea sp. CA-141351]|uniref:nuclear transport factor 2 family protein n=1 Tax=Nonomuraea sp. CA-141351 TaxID=3239996 RepID=UPI003D924FA9
MKSEFIDNRRSGRNTPSMTAENKSIVQRALTELVGTGDVDALAPLLSDDFVHHRPDSTSSSKAEWLAAVRAALIPLADMRVEIHHVLADGDHVVMYSRRWLPGAEPGIAVVDIWRLDDGLIAEAWEIIEPVAQAAANLVWWESADH